MALTVLYFARFRERLTRDEETLPWLPGDTVAALAARLAARGGDWQAVFAGGGLVMAAVNEVVATPGSPLGDGDTVAFFPPVTGG